ncbi:N-acetyl-alpha-D-glucosaminyl L-malate synthase BshA [bacterium]|nr:N-acetyl-alpha-D-glucosaminyl L-malate synthase BshA [bacterium]MBU1652113.1 N-acetyl-alpha-D-glucosaminyl L-malate synthase BshA [bacterium]MBU1881825.1 N-acetyl-alpha-D-glucosaminyl L-malate synthase BshA [bacterium]
MKIGISCYPTFGGSGVVASMLGLELARLGHQIHIVAYAPPARLTTFHPNLHFHKVEVTDYPLFEYPPYSLSLASKLLEVASQEKLHLFHVHYAIPHAVSGYLAQEMQGEQRIPMVTTLHGTDITLVGNMPSFMPITKFVLDKSDAVTAVSQSLKDETIKFFGVDREIHVVPNFVRSDLFQCPDKGGIDHRPRPPGETPTLVHISNFRPVKRVTDVIKIFALVHKKIPSQLLMVGDGPERGPAERLARELGLQDSVYFLGEQLDINSIFATANVLLQPSETESFGLTPLEAMATCTPVVASKVGGLPEVVIDGETGFLLPVGDVEGMAGKVMDLLTDPQLYLKMAASGRERALSLFNVQRIIDLYMQVYRSVLDA